MKKKTECLFSKKEHFLLLLITSPIHNYYVSNMRYRFNSQNAR